MGIIEKWMHLWERLGIAGYSLLLSGQFGSFGKKSRVAPPFRFHGLHEVSLGEKSFIGRDCWIQTLGEPAGGDGFKLVIGAYAGIGMGSSISAALRIEIGEHALLARNVYISDHAHAFADVTVPIARQGLANVKPVKIGRGAWLGQNVVVLPGVTIGQHCVIGANSVVNSDIPDFSVAVGSPARVVRQYSEKSKSWERIQAGPKL